MIENKNAECNIRQCLKDCGCDEAFAERYCQYEKEQNVAQQLKLLNCRRCAALRELHIAQRRIDCIDYLIRELGKR